MLARMKVDMVADVVVDEVANMLANMEVDIWTRWPTWWPTSRGWLIGPKLFRRHEAYPACASAKSFANSFLKPNSDCNDNVQLSLDRLSSWNIINQNGFVEDMINIKA